jgi:GMP synthase-like glutamine amidotransferase
MLWWPRHTPSTGVLPANASIIASELPASSGRPGPGEIMGVRHRTLKVEGVQFHPESVLTPEGPALMANFLTFTGGERRAGRSAEAAHAGAA